MAKVKSFRDMVKKKAYDQGLSIKEVEEIAGITRTTLNRRFNYTGELTIDEIRRLDIVLHFSEEEKLGILEKIIS